MIYELTNIENQVHPDMLRTAFSKYVPDFSLSYLGNTENPNSEKNVTLEISPGYIIILEKFKKFFFNEFCRIRISMRNHKINESKEVFSRYVSVNYSGVIRMLKNTRAKKHPETDEEEHTLDVGYLRNTHDLIYYNLQKILLFPLKEFIENEFISELRQANLQKSTSQSILQVLLNNQVTLEEPDRLQTDNSSTREETSPQKLLLLYNGFSLEADYYDYLKETFEYFQIRLSVELHNITDNFEKIRSITELEKIISSIKPLFHKYRTPNTDDFSPEYYREDSIYYLKRELEKNNIAEQINNYHRQLSSFTEIQWSFIIRTWKILKCYHKLYRYPPTVEREYSPTVSCKLPAPANSGNKDEDPGKLQWRGNINQLITFFYDASSQVLVDGKTILNASKKQIAHLLIENFIQKDGDPVNPSTINTIFTPSKELKRPPNHKRIIFPDQE